MDIFRDNEDREVYLVLLQKYVAEYDVEIYSYCLMTNHTHDVMVPPEEDSLSCLFHDLNGAYSKYFNKKYGYCGHLWQKRFFACILDDTHLWKAVRYVERNSVEAGIVERAEDYRWSSAAAHCGLREDPLLSDRFPPEGLQMDWSSWLKKEVSQEELEAIRIATRKGIPYASDAFIDELEALLGVRIRPKRTRSIVGPGDTEAK